MLSKPSKKTIAYKRVFGEDNKRTEDQEIVWNDIISRIFMHSKLEANLGETARDYCLNIHETVNKDIKE